MSGQSGGRKNRINICCLSCRQEFDSEVGRVNFETEDGAAEFEKPIVCPGCAARYVSKEGEFSDKFELTELGQSQLTALWLDDEPD